MDGVNHAIWLILYEKAKLYKALTMMIKTAENSLHNRNKLHSTKILKCKTVI